MNNDGLDISQELSGLGATLAELGASLRQASLRLLEEGMLPTESLVEQIVGIRSELKSFRARVCRLAQERGIEVPPTAELQSIKAIEMIFQHVKNAEIEGTKNREEASTARSVVERVLKLRHDRLVDYAPLASCQRRAAAFEDGTAVTRAGDEENSLTGLEPFRALLALVVNTADDESGTRESLVRRVEEAFGRSLANAASNGAIVESVEASLGIPARFQPVEGYRRIRSTSDLGINFNEMHTYQLTNEGFNASSPWFSGLGRIPRMVLDESFRPIVNETFFPAEPLVGKAAVEASAAATTDVSVYRNDLDDRETSEVLADPIGSPRVVAEEVQVAVRESRTRVIRGDSAQRASSSVGDFLVFRTDPFGGGRSRKLGNAVRRRTHPEFEQLESLQLLSCNVISGFVYLDNNNDGLYNSGDAPVANNTIQLYNASNQLVGTTTTSANGAYSFNSDATINTATKTETVSATVNGKTNYITPISIPDFNPSLGTLTAVSVKFSGQIDSTVEVENLSTSSGDMVTANYSGNITLTGPGLNLNEDLSHPPLSANLSKFDGVVDYAGTSGVNFGDVTQSGSSTKTLSTATGDDLSAFTGTGNYQGFVNGTSLIRAMGGGNLDYNADTSSTATLQVTYQYTPTDCLSPGKYTIVQPALPPGTLNGHESSNGVILPYNPVLPNKIPVTLTNMDSTNNNFGAIIPGGLGGYVYVDVNKNGIKDTGEQTLPNVPIELTGTNDVGQSITLDVTTDGNGSYSFTGLRPGDYTTRVTQQPAGYEAGQTTRGNAAPLPNSLGTNTIPGIAVAAGAFQPNNNFGEYTPGSPGGTENGGGTAPPAVEREGIHHQMTTFILHYRNAINPAIANETGNYHLYRIVNGATARREIPLRSAVYNAANRTVTLTPQRRLNVHYRYLLKITNSTTPQAVIPGVSNSLTGSTSATYSTVVSRADYPHPLQGPGVIHQALPARSSLQVRSANPGLARHHLVGKSDLGRGLSL